MTETNEITKEKTSIEQTVTILLMRLNQSLAELDSLSKFPASNKPETIQMYRSVYQDIFELSRLVRASLSESLLTKLSSWQKTSLYHKNFVSEAIELTEILYDELSGTGMINIRARKTATFPIDFYTDQLDL